MKKGTYIFGFLSAMILIGLMSSTRKSFKQLTAERHTKEKIELSVRVDMVNFISNDELYEDSSSNFDSRDDEAVIIYPSVRVGSDEGSNIFAIDSPLQTTWDGEKNFELSEFTRYDVNATEETKDKILKLHIPQLERVRANLNKPVVIRSAARSYAWEILRGRSGNSRHVYKSGKGAVDVSIIDYNTLTMDRLEQAVMDETEYTRVTRYPSFLHLDYAKNRFGIRGYYKNTKYGWIYIGEIK